MARNNAKGDTMKVRIISEALQLTPVRVATGVTTEHILHPPLIKTTKIHFFLLLVRCLSVIVFSCIADLSMAETYNGYVHLKEPAYFQFSVLRNYQLVDENKDIVGLRLNVLYGRNTDVSGLDLGLFASSSYKFSGIQINGWGSDVSTEVNGMQISGIMSFSGDSVTGIQLAGIMNGVRNDVTGLQVGLFNSTGRNIYGIQIGAINNLFQGTSITGLQAGLLNHSMEVQGMQVGLINSASRSIRGIQIGIVNFCYDLVGIQIGLINHSDNALVPWMPIINARF